MAYHIRGTWEFLNLLMVGLVKVSSGDLILIPRLFARYHKITAAQGIALRLDWL